MIPLSLHPETTSHPNAILDAFPVSIKRDILTPALANNSKKKPRPCGCGDALETLPKKIIPDIDKRPCAPFIANVADEHFGLLVKTFDRGGGGLAKRD